MSKRNKAGFTIIELLIVAAIIGLLSAVVLQSLNTARQRSRNATRLSQIDQINKAMELYATGGANKLPYSGNQWSCLGLSSGTCWGGIGWYIQLNTAVSTNIAGGAIPRDPSISTGSPGDYYVYHSSYPAITTGNCTATLCPAGAYLSWVVENSTNCGRGKHWQNVSTGSQCVLRVGDQVTTL